MNSLGFEVVSGEGSASETLETSPAVPAFVGRFKTLLADVGFWSDLASTNPIRLQFSFTEQRLNFYICVEPNIISADFGNIPNATATWSSDTAAFLDVFIRAKYDAAKIRISGNIPSYQKLLRQIAACERAQRQV